MTVGMVGSWCMASNTSSTKTYHTQMSLALSNAAKVAAGREAFYKKLAHAAKMEQKCLDQASKYGAVVSAGTRAIAENDLEQARKVDSLAFISDKGRVKMCKGFSKAKSYQLCDFLSEYDNKPKTSVKYELEDSVFGKGASLKRPATEEACAPRQAKRLVDVDRSVATTCVVLDEDDDDDELFVKGPVSV